LGGVGGIAHWVSSGEVELGIFHYFYPHIINYYIFLILPFSLFSIIFYFHYYFFIQMSNKRLIEWEEYEQNTSKWTCFKWATC
jgi:hypothetical protein